MSELEPLLLVKEKSNVSKISEEQVNHHFDTIPLFSITQEGRLDSFIAKLETAFENNQLSDLTTTSVMELYEYKVIFFIVIFFKAQVFFKFKLIENQKI